MRTVTDQGTRNCESYPAFIGLVCNNPIFICTRFVKDYRSSFKKFFASNICSKPTSIFVILDELCNFAFLAGHIRYSLMRLIRFVSLQPIYFLLIPPRTVRNDSRLVDFALKNLQLIP